MSYIYYVDLGCKVVVITLISGIRLKYMCKHIGFFTNFVFVKLVDVWGA